MIEITHHIRKFKSNEKNIRHLYIHIFQLLQSQIMNILRPIKVAHFLFLGCFHFISLTRGSDAKKDSALYQKLPFFKPVPK